MIITSITPRKDGKFLVGLHWTQGTNRRKIMTPEELQNIKARIEADRQQEIAYRQSFQNENQN